MAKKDRTGNRRARGQRKQFKVQERAIQIARQKLEQCKREGKTKPSEMCPCTTVYELVGEIKGKAHYSKKSLSRN